MSPGEATAKGKAPEARRNLICLRKSKEVGVVGDEVSEAMGATGTTLALSRTIGRSSTKKGFDPINILKRSFCLLSGEWTGRCKHGSRDALGGRNVVTVKVVVGAVVRQ